METGMAKTVQRIAIRYYKTKFKILAAISKRKAAEKAFELFCTPQSRKNNKAPTFYEEAEKLKINVEGITVRGWRFNHPAERKVLILHGYESSVTNFSKYVKAFIKKGYEVLAFDAPGHGISGGKQINAPLYKNMVIEIQKKYGPIESYIAHSFGGLAVCLALEEITHTSGYRLALIAPAAETNTAINNFFTFLKIDDSVKNEFEKLIKEKSGVDVDWFSIKRAMRHIKAKVLWINDEDDEITPISDVMKVKAKNYPNIEFVFTKGLGHSRIYRDNKVVHSVVDFL